MTTNKKPLGTEMKEKIAVLYGGNSAEREVSLKSGKAIANGLVEAGYEVQLHDTRDYQLAQLKTDNIDRVFIALHGRGGEDGSLQGALEYLGIPYTGSGVLGSALSMDKTRSKQIFQALNLPTAKFFIAHKTDLNKLNLIEVLADLGQKVMVKPANEGSSIGMTIADSTEKLHQALVTAFEFDDEVLIEAWINGPEYTIAILGDEALPVIHMETPREFYDYDAKYKAGTTLYHCPCHLNEQDTTEIQALALRAFKATGAKGWGRVDIMRTLEGQWQILEVNTVPGMTETSLVPKSAKVHGLSFSELVNRIIELS